MLYLVIVVLGIVLIHRNEENCAELPRLPFHSCSCHSCSCPTVLATSSSVAFTFLNLVDVEFIQVPTCTTFYNVCSRK